MRQKEIKIIFKTFKIKKKLMLEKLLLYFIVLALHYEEINKIRFPYCKL